MSGGRSISACAAVGLLIFAPSAVRAESAFGERSTSTPAKAVVMDESEIGDGVYGRADGDFSLSPAAGVEVDLRSTDVRLLAALSLRYFNAIGPYVTFREGFEDSAELQRILGPGVLVEPLFLYRAVKNQERGPQFWDLTLDSLGLSIGAYWAQPKGRSFGEESGAEGGLGFGIPILGTSAGPWLRTRGVGRIDQTGTGSGSLWVTLEWQAFLNLGVSAGPEIYR